MLAGCLSPGMGVRAIATVLPRCLRLDGQVRQPGPVPANPKRLFRVDPCRIPPNRLASDLESESRDVSETSLPFEVVPRHVPEQSLQVRFLVIGVCVETPILQICRLMRVRPWSGDPAKE